MKRFVTCSVSLIFAASVWAQEFKLGSKVSDFTIQDLKGIPVHYSALKGDTTVVIFISTQCPVSNAYNERMNQIYNDYSAKGVKFIFINANATETQQEVEAHAKRVGFAFPVYKDSDDSVADRFGASVTPEAYVMDRTGTIRYHGSIDDSQNPARIHVQRLRMALDAVLSGGQVRLAETKAFGCTIKRLKKVS